MVFSGFISLSCISETGAQTGKPIANRQFLDNLAYPYMNNSFDISSESLLVQNPEDICLIQAKLQKNEIILEYVITDTLMIIVCVSRYGKCCYRKQVDAHFWKTLKEYRKELKVADIENLISACKKMYNMFISPVKNILDRKTRLIIIPGRDLSGIPFESFIVDESGQANNGFSCQHYLILDFEITYHYSAKYWAWSFSVTSAYRTNIQEEPELDFAGFSPVFYSSHKVNPLPSSRDELKTIVSMFGRKGLSARIAVGEQSKKTLFLELACNSRVIHLATHNSSNFSKGELGGVLFWDYDPSSRQNVFSKGILTLNEICNLRLKADLVVLNACASGFGKKVGRSGLCSLPLGFLYAGAKNILATLWNVTDGHAGKFMVSFYRKWLSGKTYSKALREAKLDMISHRETALPTLWAPYVLIGQ